MKFVVLVLYTLTAGYTFSPSEPRITEVFDSQEQCERLMTMAQEELSAHPVVRIRAFTCIQVEGKLPPLEPAGISAELMSRV